MRAQRAVLNRATGEAIPSLAHLRPGGQRPLPRSRTRRCIGRRRATRQRVVLRCWHNPHDVCRFCQLQAELCEGEMERSIEEEHHAYRSHRRPPAPSDLAREHFAAEFGFETDCWDVHDSLARGADFVLLDVRSPALFAAVIFQRDQPTAGQDRALQARTLAGRHGVRDLLCRPHCNGAARERCGSRNSDDPSRSWRAASPAGSTRASIWRGLEPRHERLDPEAEASDATAILG